MRRAERTLLLLCGALDDGLAPLTPREYRILRLRVTQAGAPAENQLTERYLRSLGYAADAAERIASLLERQAALDIFLARAAQNGVTVLTRLSERFPERLRRLGDGHDRLRGGRAVRAAQGDRLPHRGNPRSDDPAHGRGARQPQSAFHRLFRASAGRRAGAGLRDEGTDWLALALLALVPGFGLGLMMLIECMQLGWLLAQKRPRAFISQKLFFFGLPLGLMTYRERSRAYAAE